MNPKKARGKVFLSYIKILKNFLFPSPKTFLFVDGSNLYGAQNELFGPDKFLDFAKFIAELEKKLNIALDKTLFYASYSPTPKNPTSKQKDYLKNEGLFYQSVRKTPKCVFFKGYRSPTSGKEKEVDVKLAVDIVHLAHQNQFSRLFLFSGDADFMHALLIARSLKKEINIMALENRVPYRFTFNFLTYIIKTAKKQIKINKHQKIKEIFIDKSIFVKKIC